MENKELQDVMHNAIMQSIWVDHVGDIAGVQSAAGICAQAALNHFNNRWVRVEDRLPENNSECLFTCTGLVSALTGQEMPPTVHGGYFQNGAFHSWVDPRDRWRATHWQPLPEPPKEHDGERT